MGRELGGKSPVDAGCAQLKSFGDGHLLRIDTQLGWSGWGAGDQGFRQCVSQAPWADGLLVVGPLGHPVLPSGNPGMSLLAPPGARGAPGWPELVPEDPSTGGQETTLEEQSPGVLARCAQWPRGPRAPWHP